MSRRRAEPGETYSEREVFELLHKMELNERKACLAACFKARDKATHPEAIAMAYEIAEAIAFRRA